MHDHICIHAMLISTCVYANTHAEKPVHMLTHTHRQMYTNMFGNQKYAHIYIGMDIHAHTNNKP